ncbi:MAG TPA: 50S ribosomal protein L4 [Candidatus Saccharimonadales bacterium]|nr:50S ribosomal protein L4 [Candidatus Saccharimonadales bacterium]
MASVNTYSATGTKSGAKAILDKNVFAVEVKSHGLLKQAYQAYLDNKRANLARTKTRGEVVGSTKKPWRQKGTGRARFGSRYNPIWRGGGITFGPTGEENYSKKLNQKAKKLAVKQALSIAVKENKVKVIDTFECKSGKTADTAKLLAKIEAQGSVLIVAEEKSGAVDRATRNLPKVKVVQAGYLNVFDLLNADTVVIAKKSLDSISEWLTDKVKKPVKNKEAKK